MTRDDRISRMTRGVSVLISSAALVLGAVGTAAAHPNTLISGSEVRDALIARVLLIEPGIGADELEEIVDIFIDHLEEEADDAPEVIDEVEADEDEVDEADEVEVDEADEDEVDEADEVEVDEADEDEVDEAEVDEDEDPDADEDEDPDDGDDD